MQMRLVFLPVVLVLLGLCACSDNDSGTNSMEGGKFQCNVTSGVDWVQQEIISPYTGVSVAKVVEYDDGSQTAFFIEKLDKMNRLAFSEKCDSLKRMSQRFDEGSLVCKNSRIEFSITVSVDEVSQSIKQIKRDMLEQCEEYEEEYYDDEEESSSSKESSSSIMSSSSSSPSLSSSSSFDENAYWYLYNGSRWAVSITSNCLDSACFEDFENFDFGSATVSTSTEGVDGGKALLLSGSEYIVLPWDMDEKISEGSLDFYFKPGEDFRENGSYALVGNDGARMNVIYWEGSLLFSKNLADTYITVAAVVSLNKNGWNRITAEWNAETGLIAIFLDGKQLASKETEFPYYGPSDRGRSDNVVMVGHKGSCCIDQLSEELFGVGAFDNIRVVTENIFEIKAVLDESMPK